MKRYQQVHNMQQVARELRISDRSVRRVLDRRGIPLYKKPEPDDDAILRSYDRTSQMIATAHMLAVSQQRVREVLDAHEVPHNEPGEIPEFTDSLKERHGWQ